MEAERSVQPCKERFQRKTAQTAATIMFGCLRQQERAINKSVLQQLDFLSLCISHKLWACSGSLLATTIQASEADSPRAE